MSALIILNKSSGNVISNIDNLCFTKRRHNSKKRGKTEQEFKSQI
jgi:hypothetical protein